MTEFVPPLYVPILKGRMGELRALERLGLQYAQTLTPLVEIPLTVPDAEGDSPDEPLVLADPAKFAEAIRRRWPEGRWIILDAGLAPPLAGGQPATSYLVDELARGGHLVIPTVRPSDAQGVVESIGASIAQWRLGSACIRLSGDDLDDRDVPLSRSLDALLGQLALAPSAVDLVVDLGPVQDARAVAFAARIARLVLSEIPHLADWRTVVCASAGFPPDLSSVQPEVLTELPRHDAALWRLVAERARDRVPAFGDYGIAYPSIGGGAAFAPAPQLRFTWDDNWLVFKGRKSDRRGSKQFFDICRRMVEAGVVQADLSWGDEYVDRAAAADNGGLGPGNAMMWRAIGTSHHLAYVANRLATVGAP